VLLVLMLVLAIIVPILSKSRYDATNQKRDMAPLVTPQEQRPPVLPVPN